MSSLLVVSSDKLQFLGSAPEGEAAGPPPPFPFAITAFPGPGGIVSFALAPPSQESEGEAGEAICIEDLGAQLPDWEEEDLLSSVLEGYFAALSQELPDGIRTTRHRVYVPFWMGPRERRLFRRAAQAAGLFLGEELERGLAPVLTRVWQGAPPPSSGGWIVVDRCGSDLDLYGVFDRSTEAGREVGLVDYRRCPQIFSALYEARPAAARQVVTAALAMLPSGWGFLATEESAASLLAAQAASSEWEIHPFAEHAAALAAQERSDQRSTIPLSRSWRYWLDDGDDRLEPLGDGGSSYPQQLERLLVIPESPPEHLRIGVRVGFHPTRPETQEVCQVRISRPDLLYASGFLLMHLRLHGPGRGELEIEVVQRGGSVHTARTSFSTY
jgi:hypothetical protein